jgi:uncharacterized lipoprotein
MVEIYTTTTRDATVWTPRASDPELEIEFLRRLMMRLGDENQTAGSSANKTAIGASASSSSTSMPSDVKVYRRIYPETHLIGNFVWHAPLYSILVSITFECFFCSFNSTSFRMSLVH